MYLFVLSHGPGRKLNGCPATLAVTLRNTRSGRLSRIAGDSEIMTWSLSYWLGIGFLQWTKHTFPLVSSSSIYSLRAGRQSGPMCLTGFGPFSSRIGPTDSWLHTFCMAHLIRALQPTLLFFNCRGSRFNSQNPMSPSSAEHEMGDSIFACVHVSKMCVPLFTYLRYNYSGRTLVSSCDSNSWRMWAAMLNCSCMAASY